MLVVWRKKENEYYYKRVKGYYANYDIGYTNQYGHVVILVIKDNNTPRYKFSFRTRFIRKLIFLLKKLERG